jgi:hypothetical protein
LIPLDVWYILPEERVLGKRTILLFPNSKRSKFKRYREAWNLLTGGETVEETPPIPMTDSHPFST